MRWVILFLAGMAVLLGSISYYSFKSTRELLGNGATTSGTVVHMEYNRSTDSSGGVYYPIVRFETNNGIAVQGKARVGSSPPTYKDGDTVRVYYDQKNPKESWILDNWFDLWFVATLTGAFAAGLSIATIIVTWYHLRRKPRISGGNPDPFAD